MGAVRRELSLATTTARLALTKPAKAERVNVDVINNNMDAIDDGTSKIWIASTKPAEMKPGDVLFKTM